LTPIPLLAFAVAFAMTGICTALALEGGSSPLTVVTVRTFVAIALVAGWFLYHGISFKLGRNDLVTACLIGIPLCINNYLINAAIAEIPVPLAVLIFYTWPALTTAGSWLTGKERFRWRTAAALGLAFAGVALTLNVELTAAQAKGVWMALGAALMWSATFLLTGHYFHGRDSRAPTLYMMGTALAAFLLACLAGGGVAWPATPAGWSGIGGVGAFYAFALIGLLMASVRIGATRAGFYMNFEPIASVLLAALILGQRLAPVQLAGAGLVIAALFLFRPPPAAASPSRRS
jgi:drug/metabolite transporter (DMT)-like permease